MRLAVFPGRSGSRTARLVCADDRLAGSAIGPLLARLVEQSMVQSGNGRFWLLDTLRTYASELIADDELSRLRAPACPGDRGAW